MHWVTLRASASFSGGIAGDVFCWPFGPTFSSPLIPALACPGSVDRYSNDPAWVNTTFSTAASPGFRVEVAPPSQSLCFVEPVGFAQTLKLCERAPPLVTVKNTVPSGTWFVESVISCSAGWPSMTATFVVDAPDRLVRPAARAPVPSRPRLPLQPPLAAKTAFPALWTRPSLPPRVWVDKQLGCPSRATLSVTREPRNEPFAQESAARAGCARDAGRAIQPAAPTANGAPW